MSESVNDSGCMWAGILGWQHNYDRHGICPCGDRQTRNPLADGDFCDVCGTRISDRDFHGTVRTHACPLCGPA